MIAFVAVLLAVGPRFVGPGATPRSGAAVARCKNAVEVVRTTRDGHTSGDAPPAMALLPDGRFRMGVPFSSVAALAAADPSHADRLAAISPDHEVAVDALYLDCFEVTNEQFKGWLDATKRAPSPELLAVAWNFVDHGRHVEGIPPGAEKLPVRAVTFDEAVACARFLGKRLPTEAEWEYAARRGRPAADVYPWGGWSSWDPRHCASVKSALRGATITTFLGGSFADDRSFDGLFDLCGNVAEWTDSPFLAYPGFEAPKLDDHGKKRVVTPDFTSGRKVVRGGSSWGSEFTNSLVARSPTALGAAPSDVGFRGALSAVAGLDALRAAVDDLAPALRSDRKRVELGVDAIAAETIHYVDADARLCDRARHVAVARVRGAEKSLAETRRTSVETPVLVGIATFSEPATQPEFGAGSYLLRFRAKGVPKSERLGVPEKERGDHGDHGGRATPTGATPTPPPGAMREVTAPRDRDVLLLEDEQGRLAGWVAVATRDSSPHATRLTVADHDGAVRASCSFTLKEPRSGAALELAFDLDFARGSFEPR
jgi:formylglycine-generating enzyme required for sulfatase activity